MVEALAVTQSCRCMLWFNFILGLNFISFCNWEWKCMIMSLKQKQINTRIKLKHNMYMEHHHWCKINSTFIWLVNTIAHYIEDFVRKIERSVISRFHRRYIHTLLYSPSLIKAFQKYIVIHVPHRYSWYQICGIIWGGFIAKPPSYHQHCTNEAQRAETVLSTVSYTHI